MFFCFLFSSFVPTNDNSLDHTGDQSTILYDCVQGAYDAMDHDSWIVICKYIRELRTEIVLKGFLSFFFSGLNGESHSGLI